MIWNLEMSLTIKLFEPRPSAPLPEIDWMLKLKHE